MNIILDKLPFKYNGLEINTDFRISILFELLMQDEKISYEEKIEQAVRLYFTNTKGNLEKAFKNLENATNTIIWFYTCANEEIKEKIKKNKKKQEEIKENQVYSYEFDAQYIYSAFLEQYNIDLQDITLHWWKFRALFKGLNENLRFSKIMSYRSIKLSEIKDKDEKNRIKKLKKIYALPDMRTEEEKQRDFGKAFW